MSATPSPRGAAREAPPRVPGACSHQEPEDDTSTRCAECEVKRQLFFAIGASCENQVRHVYAGDEQYEDGRRLPHQQERGGADIDDRAAERHRVDTAAAIRVRIFLFEAQGEEIELSPSVRDARFRRELSDDLKVIAVPNRRRLRVEPEGCPDFRAEGIVEVLFSHAYDVVALAIQENRLA